MPKSTDHTSQIIVQSNSFDRELRNGNHEIDVVPGALKGWNLWRTMEWASKEGGSKGCI